MRRELKGNLARFNQHHKSTADLRLKSFVDPRDSDPSKEGVFRDHNCYRCQSGARPCIKGKGNERDCDTLRARND